MSHLIIGVIFFVIAMAVLLFRESEDRKSTYMIFIAFLSMSNIWLGTIS